VEEPTFPYATISNKWLHSKSCSVCEWHGKALNSQNFDPAGCVPAVRLPFIIASGDGIGRLYCVSKSQTCRLCRADRLQPQTLNVNDLGCRHAQATWAEQEAAAGCTVQSNANHRAESDGASRGRASPPR
jgi:hypothetical protein